MVECRLFILKLRLFAFFAFCALLVVIGIAYIFTGRVILCKIDKSKFRIEPRFKKAVRIWGSVFCLVMASLIIYCSMIPTAKDLAIILRNDPPNYVEGYIARADRGRSRQLTMMTVIIDEDTNEEVKISHFKGGFHPDHYASAYYYPNTMSGIIFKPMDSDQAQGAQ